MRESSRRCEQCEKATLHRKPHIISDGMGCLITIITLGTFFPFWVALALLDFFYQPWICQTCGMKNK